MDYGLVTLWVWSVVVIGFLLYKIRILEEKVCEFEDDVTDNINDIFTILVEMDKKKTKGSKSVKRQL